jgi:drug/metabolite transporter (DMT)-like permease
MTAALALCVVASVGYGGGAVLQAAGAARPGSDGLKGVVATGRQPLFLLGLVLDLACWAISRVALRTLPLFVVQIILAGSVAITALLAHLFLSTRLRRTDRYAVCAAILGLVLVGFSVGHVRPSGVSHALQLRVLLAIPLLILVGVLAVRRSNSIVLAVVAGASFTGSALAARAAHLHHRSFVHLLRSPMLWAVVVYAVLAVGLHIVALRKGAVGPVTASMWSTEVLLATLIGTVALGDHVRHGWVVPATLGMAATLGATVMLARSPSH